MATNSRFAEELNAILEQTSMSAEDVVVELNKYGFPLPLYTFSYWLQGYFLPRSDSAFQLVGILENICGVTNNCLSDALLHDLSSSYSFVPGDSTQSDLVGSFPFEKVGNTGFSTAADRAVDWEANVIQKAVRDEVYVNAERTYTRHKAIILARVPAVPNPTFVFQILYLKGEDPGSDRRFYDLSGMTLRKQEIFNEGDMTVCAAQFALPDDVIPGDLHRLSYSWGFCYTGSHRKNR